MRWFLLLTGLYASLAAAESGAPKTPAPERVDARFYILMKGKDATQNDRWLHIAWDNAAELAKAPTQDAESKEPNWAQAYGFFQMNKTAVFKIGNASTTLTTKDGELLWDGEKSPKDARIQSAGSATVLTGQQCSLDVDDDTPIQYLEQKKGELYELKTLEQKQGVHVQLLIGHKTDDGYPIDLHVKVARLADPGGETRFGYDLGWAMKPPAMAKKTIDTNFRVLLKSETWTGITSPMGGDCCFLMFFRLARNDEQLKLTPKDKENAVKE